MDHGARDGKKQKVGRQMIHGGVAQRPQAAEGHPIRGVYSSVNIHPVATFQKHRLTNERERERVSFSKIIKICKLPPAGDKILHSMLREVNGFERG